MTIENQILKAIDDGKTNNVNEVISLLGEKFTEAEILKAIKGLEDKEKIELNHNIPTPYNFLQYVKNPDYNLWLYLVFLASLGTSATIYVVPNIYPLAITRLILGSLFILFLPGYTLIKVFFPKKSGLEGIERLALSMGLSLAIVPLIGLLLNFTPWGIKLNPIIISLTLFTLALSLLAAHRKFTHDKNLHIKHKRTSKKVGGNAEK